MVLSDIGGEKLMRFKKELLKLIGNSLEFIWDGKNYKYDFQTLTDKSTWNNKKLFVDGDGLINAKELSSMMEDVSMLLLFGGSSINEKMPADIIERCIIGAMLGKTEELEAFVKQRYIWVSRITGGATANTLGQLTQIYVQQYLKTKLPTWRFNKDSLPKVSQNKRTALSVDIVARSPKGNFCAIEVSFQVTTNSTIERKSGSPSKTKTITYPWT